MRVVALVALAALIAAPSLAQTVSPMTGTTAAPPVVAPATADAPAHPRRPRQALAQRFEAANTTHDGHLTREQAQGKLPQVYRRFDEIDTAHKGYVTVDEVRAYARTQRQARRAAHAQ